MVKIAEFHIGTKKLLRRHQCRRITISLGAYGAPSPKLAAYLNMLFAAVHELHFSLIVSLVTNGFKLSWDVAALKVTLFGNAPWLEKLCFAISSQRKAQLNRVQSFLKLENTRHYIDKNGRRKCVPT